MSNSKRVKILYINAIIYASIDNEGFSEQRLQLIDNYIKIYSMERQTLFNSINRSMRVSAAQVRLSSGRASYATTREKALKQVRMLEQAKQAYQTGK